MDQLKISEFLALHPYGALTILAFEMRDWGQELVFTCLYDPGDPGRPARVRLVFGDCRDIRWRVYAHLAPGADDAMPPTPIINLALGSDTHRKPAHILTDAFGLSVLYGTLTLSRLEQP